MKKNKAAKKPKVSLKDQFKHTLNNAQSRLAGHGVFILFVFAGAAIGFSLLRSRAYLNPSRSESHYAEVTGSTVISNVDTKLVNKLQDALADTDITVNPQLAPNRSNPFSE